MGLRILILVKTPDGQIQGFGMLTPPRMNKQPKQIDYLTVAPWNLLSSPDPRATGTGSFAMEEAMEAGFDAERSRKLDRTKHLQAFEIQAPQFFEKMGFLESEEEKRAHIASLERSELIPFLGGKYAARGLFPVPREDFPVNAEAFADNVLL